MKKATEGFDVGYEERRHRHHTGHEPVEAGPTMAAMNEPSERAAFSFRVKPDRRRLVIAIDPATERRRG
jgi:hypothetical protein